MSGFALEKPSTFGKRIFNIAAVALSAEDEVEEIEEVGKKSDDMPDVEDDIESGENNIESSMEQID